MLVYAGVATVWTFPQRASECPVCQVYWWTANITLATLFPQAYETPASSGRAATTEQCHWKMTRLHWLYLQPISTNITYCYRMEILAPIGDKWTWTSHHFVTHDNVNLSLTCCIARDVISEDWADTVLCITLLFSSTWICYWPTMHDPNYLPRKILVEYWPIVFCPLFHIEGWYSRIKKINKNLGLGGRCPDIPHHLSIPLRNSTFNIAKHSSTLQHSVWRRIIGKPMRCKMDLHWTAL